MGRVGSALELLKQSRSGKLQRIEALLQRSLFLCGLSFGRLLLARFPFLNLIRNRLAFPATSHSLSLPNYRRFSNLDDCKAKAYEVLGEKDQSSGRS